MTSSHPANGYELRQIVDEVRAYAGIAGKGPIAAVADFIDTSDPLHGPGDDGAVIESGGMSIVVCGEALSPPFVAADPYGAGIAAILANVNDVAAMGGIPLGIVNTLVGPASTTREVMRGMADAARMYDVAIIGGHLTERDGDTSVSAFAVGRTESALSMANVAPGQIVLFAGFLDGNMREDFPFFTSIREQEHRFGADIRVLHEVAATGAAVAAKDVSMAGSLGSLAMLLEYRGLGARIVLDRLPTPAGVDFLTWLKCFPSYGFWLTATEDRAADCIAIFEANDLVCAAVGFVSDNSSLFLLKGEQELELLDFATESITGLWA